MISFKVHDVTNVLSYMGEEESCERVYSFSRLCSSNPDLAAKQMELYRVRYCESRNCTPKERELLGLHFFFSYTEEDDPSEAVMNHITKRLCDHPLFRGHAILGANHFDKHCKHTHFGEIPVPADMILQAKEQKYTTLPLYSKENGLVEKNLD